MPRKNPILDQSTYHSHQEVWSLTSIAHACSMHWLICLTGDHAHKHPLFPVDGQMDKWMDGQTDGQKNDYSNPLLTVCSDG